jgi:multidrug efflux pump subunit AcrA (membrane-fusion protein)
MTAKSAPEASDVLTEMPRWAAPGLLYLIIALVAVGLVWAHFSVVDLTVTARGVLSAYGAEALVRNRDIGRIEPGLAAKLKIDAYPFQDFGVLPATVTSIAADAVRDEEAGSAYKVRLTPGANPITKHGRPVELRNGLTLTADIVTDRKTMLSILLEPFRRMAGRKSGK